MGWEEIADENRDAMDLAAEELVYAYTSIADSLTDKIRRALGAITEYGKFDTKDKKVSAKIQSIIETEVGAFFAKGYIRDAVNDYVGEIERIFASVNTINQQLNGSTILKDRFAYILPQLQNEALRIFGGSSGSAGQMTFVDTLRTEVVNAVLAQNNLNQIETLIRRLLATSPTHQGLLERYAGGNARDILYGANGALNEIIKEAIGATAYRYVGSLKPGVRRKLKNGKLSKVRTNESRPQCKKWVGMEVIKLVDLSSEISWAFRNGSGMNPATTTANFTIYRGGYFCRHEAIPFLL